MKTLREQAENVAYGLGIAVYIRGDRIYQHEPGERIEPAAGAKPVLAGRGDSMLSQAEPEAPAP